MNSSRGIFPALTAYRSTISRKTCGSSREKTWLIVARISAETARRLSTNAVVEERLVLLLAAALVALGVIASAAAAPCLAAAPRVEYPTKFIRFIVPWAPGGSSDVLARTLDLGGEGGILVASHIVGPRMRQMVDEPQRRSEIHEALHPVFEALSVAPAATVIVPPAEARLIVFEPRSSATFAATNRPNPVTPPESASASATAHMSEIASRRR